MIDKRLESVFASIADTAEAGEAATGQRKQELAQLSQEYAQLKATVEELKQDTVLQLQGTTKSITRLKAELQFEIDESRQNGETERQEAAKMRRNLTAQVQAELAKLQGLDGITKHEFQRINKIIKKSTEAMKLLMEDQMLM